MDACFLSTTGPLGTLLSTRLTSLSILQVLDEATSALDANTEAAVQKTLDRFIQANNMTVVIIAHRLATVQNCNQIVVLHKGTVKETGTHEELLSRGGIYSDLVTQQALGHVSASDTDMDEKQDTSHRRD